MVPEATWAVIVPIGMVNIFMMIPSAGREVGELHCTRPLGGYCRARHLSPDPQSGGHFLKVPVVT
jgi:hypothetical protein